MGLTNIQAILANYSTMPVQKMQAGYAPRRNEMLPAYTMKGQPNLNQPETRNFDPNAGDVRGELYLMA